MTYAGSGRRCRDGSCRALVLVLSTLVASTGGCDIFTGPDDALGLEFEMGRLEVVEESPAWSPVPITHLAASVRGVYRGRDSVAVSFPRCIPELEAVRGAGPADDAEASWRLIERRSWPEGSGFACALGFRTTTLGPGDTVSAFEVEVPLAEILADSLPVGVYSFRVRTPYEATRGAASFSGVAALDLGSVELPTSAYPLPVGVVFRDGFRFEVEVAPGGSGEDDIVRLGVSHSGSSGNGLTRDLSLRCPIRLFAFETDEARLQIPVPQPAWRWPGPVYVCGEETTALRLEPGERVDFQYRIPGIRIPQGTEIDDYVYVAVIEVDGRPLRFAVDPS